VPTGWRGQDSVEAQARLLSGHVAAGGYVQFGSRLGLPATVDDSRKRHQGRSRQRVTPRRGARPIQPAPTARTQRALRDDSPVDNNKTDTQRSRALSGQTKKSHPKSNTESRFRESTRHSGMWTSSRRCWTSVRWRNVCASPSDTCDGSSPSAASRTSRSVGSCASILSTSRTGSSPPAYHRVR
jgi:hypothetical protein